MSRPARLRLRSESMSGMAPPRWWQCLLARTPCGRMSRPTGGVKMARRVFGMLVAASLGVAAATSPAWAHHSFAAAYDADAPVTVRGVIVEARLVNPHSRIVLDVKDSAGNVTRWGFEAQTPTALVRNGVKPDVFRARIRGDHSRRSRPGHDAERRRGARDRARRWPVLHHRAQGQRTRSR